MKHRTNIITNTIVSALGVLALSPIAHALTPPPGGGYPGGNTAEGQNALLGLTTGTYNTAVGYFSLVSNSTQSFNTAIGAGALLANTADENTAVGAGALLSNTTGSGNTANGVFGLFANTVGQNNTADGTSALQSNTEGSDNTAIGRQALFNNTSGGSNTAVGDSALINNTQGGVNTAVGLEALENNSTGSNNTATGVAALGGNTSANDNTGTGHNALEFNTTGAGNTAVGSAALSENVVGSNNTALGYQAGLNANGSNNIYIGAGIEGLAGDDGACRIGSIYGATITNGTEVFANSDNRLGTITSSRRFKQNITPTSSASEGLYELRPVRFQYKKEIDPEGRWQFGLVAEDVEKVNPNLVVRDKEGKPYSVRYDQVNAMLLNEFLKEHKKVEQLQATVERQQKDFQAEIVRLKKTVTAQLNQQAAQIQKVSLQVQVSKPGRQTVASGQ